MMNLEQLPNEILLHVFQFLGFLNRVRGFGDLNIRFHTLIYHRYARHCFYSYWWSKRQFDTMCQQYLPRLRAQIVALNLCEEVCNPGVVDLFFSYAPSLAEFTCLRSLTVSDLHCRRLKRRLIEQLPSLLSLQHLRLTFHIKSTQDDTADDPLIDHVWSLPKLADCTIHDDNALTKEMFNSPSVVSSSLQRVSLTGRGFAWSTLDQLLQHTPNLCKLCAYIFSNTDDYTPSSSFPKLIKLDISIFEPSSSTNLLRFLQSAPNLRHLNTDLPMFINGHQWQQLIRAHLPDLRTLDFSMHSDFDGEDRLNALMDTFRTSFWIDERRWYVRCFTEEFDLCVQTSSIPQFFDSWPHHQLFKSTDPEETIQENFQNLSCIYSSRFFDQPLPADIQLIHLESLSLNLPVAEQFWRVVPQLEQLKSLRIRSNANQFASQLRTILDRAPRLGRLYFMQEASEPMHMSWLELASASLRHLTLRGRPLKEEECRTLSRSPLAKQCETLHLCVDNRENILTLVHDLPTLRALHLSYESVDEELVQWLREHLPTSCFVSSRSAYSTTSVRIWLS